MQSSVAARPDFVIEAHVGVGPVALGMTREEVRAALSVYPGHGLDQTSRPTLDNAFGSSLQVDYGADGRALFIGVSFYPACGCDYSFRGRHIGDYAAEELFALLADLDGGDHTFDEADYRFPNLAMTVWGADPQYDYRHGEARPVFAQIAVTKR